MCVVLIRSLILYILVIFAVRLMGKRQLGELQPSELVITILISNIATLPIEDVNVPVIVGATPILALVCFEVLVSWLTLKVPRMRKVISGSPKIIISDGKIAPDVLRELRFSVDDLLMALRAKDIFDVSEVQFAIVETTGTVSVMKKPSEDTPTRMDMKIAAECSDPPMLLVADGQILENSLQSLKLSRGSVEMLLKAHNIRLSEVFLMTADSSGSCYLAEKNGGTPKMLTIGGKNNDKS